LPGKYTFEKYIGGNFLGEIARFCLEKLHTAGLLHLQDPQQMISRQNSFPSKMITDIEQDRRDYNKGREARTTHTYTTVAAWLGDKQSENKYIEDDIKIVQYVCAAVSERCALLASLCVAEFCNRNTKVEQTVAVDGSVFKHHPLMKERMTYFMKLYAPTKKVLVQYSIIHIDTLLTQGNLVLGRGWVW